jgi:hypothetical protein
MRKMNNPPHLPQSQSVFSCTMEKSNDLTFSHLANWLSGGRAFQDGSWSRTALDIFGGGNAVTGVISAVPSLFSGSFTAFAQTQVGVMADPSMGFNPAVKLATGREIFSPLGRASRTLPSLALWEKQRLTYFRESV